MKKKLLNLVFCIVACVNVFVFYSFTNSTQDACDSGQVVPATISVRPPYDWPIYDEDNEPSGWKECTGVYGNGHFKMIQLAEHDRWFMLVKIEHGSSLYQNKKYGNMGSGSTPGVRIYKIGVGTCEEYPSPNGSYAFGNSECHQFRLDLKTNNTNIITVSLVSPVGYFNSGNRSILRYQRTIQGTDVFQGQHYYLDGSPVNNMTYHHYSTANACVY